MQYQADQLRRTRRLQVQIVRISVILMALLTGALVVVILLPVRSALELREEREFGVRARLVCSEVEGYFDQSVQLALQVPSRTRIREELVAYLSGEGTRQSYIDFTQPKLQDAVDASPGMVAVFRYAPDGRPLIGAYTTSDELPEVILDARGPVVIPGTTTIRRQLVVLIQVPIDHAGYGLAGFDIVAVSAEPLRAAIRSSTKSMRGATVIVATSDGQTADVAVTSAEDTGSDQAVIQAVTILNPEVPKRSSEPLRFEIAGETRVAAIDRFRTGWYTIVHQSESVLFESVRADTGVFLVVVIVIGLSAVVVAGLVLGFLSRRTLAETGQLTQVVDEQTEQLKLLLNEVHHRVKNDITLMNSFLSLKALDADTPEAEEALAEAQKMLLTMGRVYELLHRSGDYGEVSLKPLFDGLVDQAMSISGEQRIAIDRHLGEFSVDTKTAIPLAIIANELLTNAAKYGAREEKTLGVRVSLDRVGEKGVSLTVSDDGPPFGRDVLAGEYGFGLRMVQALTDQLGGEMSLSNDPQPTAAVRVPANGRDRGSSLV